MLPVCEKHDPTVISLSQLYRPVTDDRHATYAYRMFQKSSPPKKKTFQNIFTSVKSFCVKFFKFVGNSYPHISANFCTFILKISPNGVNFSLSTRGFHRVKFWVMNANASWARTWWESHHFQLYPDKGWKFGLKSAVESTTLAQPFCVNQAVGLGDLPQRLHVQVVILWQLSHW